MEELNNLVDSIPLIKEGYDIYINKTTYDKLGLDIREVRGIRIRILVDSLIENDNIMYAPKMHAETPK